LAFGVWRLAFGVWRLEFARFTAPFGGSVFEGAVYRFVASKSSKPKRSATALNAER